MRKSRRAGGSLNRDFNRMGTTCTALVLCSQGAVFGHVGDSRAYRIRGDRIDQLTFDHSLHWELVRQGRMRPEDVFLHESRHVITRSLGPEPTVQIDIEGPYPVLPGDVYVFNVLRPGLTQAHVTGRRDWNHRPRASAARGLSAARQPGQFAGRIGQRHRRRRACGGRPRRCRTGRGAAQNSVLARGWAWTGPDHRLALGSSGVRGRRDEHL